MEHLIRWKAAIETLDKPELINIINLFDKQYIIAIFFKYFNSELINAVSISQINNNIVPEIQIFTDKIDDVIKSRKTKSKQIDDSDFNITTKNDDEEEFEPMQLDRLPTVMISSIASFLQFPDILNFEKCNKTIFIGTRSPISVNGMPASYSSELINYLKQNRNHKSFHWNRFKSINKFELEMDDYCRYNDAYDIERYEYVDKLKDIPINWNDLKMLEIKDVSFQRKEDDIFIRDFMNDLSLFRFDNLETFKTDTMPTLSPNLSNALSLQFVKLYSDDDNVNLSNNIRGFAVQAFETFTDIPQNIESLHLPQYATFDDRECKFNNLKEICIHDKCVNFFNTQSLDKLERIKFNVCNEDLNICEKSVESLFKAPNINYISITTNKMNMMMNILNNALKEMYKKSIKIRLDHWCDAQFDAKEFKKQILEMVDFMIICSIGTENNDKIYLKSILDSLLIECKMVINVDGTDKPFNFVITNKDCKMNGYQEKWIMTCYHCEQYYQCEY